MDFVADSCYMCHLLYCDCGLFRYNHIIFPDLAVFCRHMHVIGRRMGNLYKA